MSFVQGAGSTYADLYQHGIDRGLKPEEARRAAAGAAIASGAVSAALGKIMPGGAQALNNPATREAAKKSFGMVLKSALKGAAEEIPQEVIDGGFNHIATEMAKGRTFNEAAASYAEQFPQSVLTTALLGGTAQAAGDHRGGVPAGSTGKTPGTPSGPDRVDPSVPAPRPGEQGFTVAAVDGPDVPAPKPGTPPEKPGAGVPITPTAVEGGGAPGPEEPSSSWQQIPQDTTKTNQEPSPAGGSSQPVPGAPPAAPAATLKDAEKVLGNIERLKEKQKAGTLSLDEQRELAHAENVVALTQVANLEAEQQALRKLPQPRELDPAKAEALEKAREVLKRPWPGGAEKPAGAGGEGAFSQTGGSGGQPPAGAGNGQSLPVSPAGEPPSRVPTTEEVGDAQKAIDRLKAKEKNGGLSKDEQIELHHAENLLARSQVTHLEAKQKALGKLPTPRDLHSSELEALTKAKAMLARPWPGTAPLPAIPDARRTIQDLSNKASAGVPLNADEARQLAHAQRAIAQQRVNDLAAAEANGTLTDPQRRQLQKFRDILAASPYGTELPKGPPPGYDPHATNAAHREWYPPHGDKPVHPSNDKFTPAALAIPDGEVKSTMDRLKAKGHAHDRHGPEVTEGQLSDRAMHGIDPITQTKEDGERSGADHNYSKHATQFTSERAMAQAVKSVESSTEYRDALNEAQQNGENTFTVEDVPLESALGANYEEHVRGRTRQGSAANPTGSRPTILTKGTIFAKYKRNPATGEFYLVTMFAKPSKVYEP